MSKERLQDLQTALEKASWLVSREASSLRTPENEVIRWNIVHCESGKSLEMQFHLLGDLGQKTSNLNDILYCRVSETGLKLYFAKRNTDEWKNGIVTFVNSLADS